MTPRRAEIAVLIVILLLAAGLRLGWPGVQSFAYDEARLSRIALDMARGGVFAALGMPSSAGPPNPPAAAWVFALPSALSPDPLIASAFAGLVGVAMVGGAWALARSRWGAFPALTAALLLAASPYAVLYGRSVWSQNLLPMLGLLWLWTAAYADSRPAARAAHAFIAGFAFQVHIAGIGLALGTAALIAWGGWWRRPLPLLIGAVLAGLALLPFVAHVLCCAPEVIDGYRTAGAGGARFSIAGFTETPRLALALDWGFLAAGEAYPLAGLQPGWLLMALYAVGVVRLAAHLRRADPLARAVAAGVIATPLTFFMLTTPALIHYLLAGLPALALIVGLAAQGRGRIIGMGLAAAVTLAWAVQIGAGLTIAAEQATPGGLGTPLGLTRGVAAAVPDPVMFFTHGDDITRDGEAAVFDVHWWGRDARIIDGRSLLILPPTPAYLLATLAPFQAWEEIEAAGLASNATIYPRRAGEGPGFIGAAYDGVRDPAGFTAIAPIRFDHGVQLEGWKARRVGPRLRVSTLWRVVDAPPVIDVQQFHHLRDESTLGGEPLAIADVSAGAHDWRPGDRLIVMADFFTEAEGPFWVDVGHYTLADLARLPGAAGDSARLGSFVADPPQ